MSRDLAGTSVLVTRPADRAAALCAAIEAAGGEAVRFPVMRIAGIDGTAIAERLVDAPEPDLIVFVSVSAVEHGIAALGDKNARIAAIGPATAAALDAAGRSADVVPMQPFDSESLLLHPALADVAGHEVLIVRGEDGRELLTETLHDRGANVTRVAVYRREAAETAPEELVTRWRAGGIDAVTVMSAKTLEFLLAALPEEAIGWLRQTTLVGPGERVIKTASELVPGIPAIAASGPRAEDMVNALLDWRHSDGRS